MFLLRSHEWSRTCSVLYVGSSCQLFSYQLWLQSMACWSFKICSLGRRNFATSSSSMLAILFVLIFEQNLTIYPLIVVTPFIFLLRKHSSSLRFHLDVMPSYHYTMSAPIEVLPGWCLSWHTVGSRISCLSCRTNCRYLLPSSNQFPWMFCMLIRWTTWFILLVGLELLFVSFSVLASSRSVELANQHVTAVVLGFHHK